MQEDYCKPLESGAVFLCKRGFINGDNARALVSAVPGSRVVWVTEMDAVKVLVHDYEPLDRIAGAISENP